MGSSITREPWESTWIFDPQSSVRLNYCYYGWPSYSLDGLRWDMHGWLGHLYVYIWVCLKIEKTPFYPMVFMIIIPIKWLFHWEYTLFSDKPIYIYICNIIIQYLVGGLEHDFYFPWYMGCHPSHWLSYFSRWLLHHQPDIYIYTYIT